MSPVLDRLLVSIFWSPLLFVQFAVTLLSVCTEVVCQRYQKMFIKSERIVKNLSNLRWVMIEVFRARDKTKATINHSYFISFSVLILSATKIIAFLKSVSDLLSIKWKYFSVGISKINFCVWRLIIRLTFCHSRSTFRVRMGLIHFCLLMQTNFVFIFKIWFWYMLMNTYMRII